MRNVLGYLLAINAIGILFGFSWYKGQLERSLPYFFPFIPDSPVAALFLVFALGAYLQGKAYRWLPYVMALAVTWLIQYGGWCVIVLSWEWVIAHKMPGEGYVLLFVHAGMAGEAIVLPILLTGLQFTHKQLVFACVTLYLHDYVDYVYNTFPFLPRLSMLPAITLITPLITTIILIYYWSQVERWQKKMVDISGRSLRREHRERH